MDTRSVLQISLIFLMSLSLVVSEPPLSSQYGVPGNYAGSNSNGGGNGFEGHGYDSGSDQDYIDNQPKSYEFDYAVRDQATGNDFGRKETSDGETVRGEYRVQLPDGRTQIVTYTADWRTGFHAEVRYEGTATYPDQYNNQNGNYNNQNGNYNNQNGNYNNQNGNYNNQNGNYNNQHGNYNNNNNNNNNNSNGQGFGYQGKNDGYNGGNNGGYNNYRSSNGGYNSGNNYQYQFGSNSIDSYSNFGARTGYNPSPTYGPAFR